MLSYWCHYTINPGQGKGNKDFFPTPLHRKQKECYNGANLITLEESPMEAVTIRPAAPEDAPALLAIYAPYVRETAITFEYEVPTPEEFAGRIRRTLERYPIWPPSPGARCWGTPTPEPSRSGPPTTGRWRPPSTCGRTSGAGAGPGPVSGVGALSGRPAHPESQRLYRRPRPGGGPLSHWGQRRIPRQAGLSAGGAVPQVRLQIRPVV